MANTVVTSFSATRANKQFLDSYQNKSEQINTALDIYRKFILQQRMIEGFLSRDEEDIKLAMLDFDDYSRLIKQRENA